MFGGRPSGWALAHILVLSTTTYLSLRSPASNRSRTLLPVLLLKLLNAVTITPILHSLHWLKITERIEYKLLSLTYKVLTTTQPPYLHNLISVQPPRNTRSSYHVTFARPPTSSSSLRITDRSFRYSSPCLWNQLCRAISSQLRHVSTIGKKLVKQQYLLHMSS